MNALSINRGYCLTIMFALCLIDLGCSDQSGNTTRNSKLRVENAISIDSKSQISIPVKYDLKCQADNECPHNIANAQCVNGVCVASGPGCLYDSDCYDSNECTEHFCQDQKCIQAFRFDGSICELPSESQGECYSGTCLPTDMKEKAALVCDEFWKKLDVLENESLKRESKKEHRKYIKARKKQERRVKKKQRSLSYLQSKLDRAKTDAKKILFQEEIDRIKSEIEQEAELTQPLSFEERKEAAPPVKNEICLLEDNDCLKYNPTSKQIEHVANGMQCENEEGGIGMCSNGYCKYRADLHTDKKECDSYFNHRKGRYVKRCKSSIKMEIPLDKIEVYRGRMKASISKTLFYDTHVGLIQTFDGGYNIVITNTREKDVVRGMIDPSLVAWEVAQFTQKTNWRSNNAQIWTIPRHDGWHIPTSGSRKALRKGKAAAGVLGQWFGVVQLTTYRKWLEKKFRYLEKGY